MLAIKVLDAMEHNIDMIFETICKIVRNRSLNLDKFVILYIDSSIPLAIRVLYSYNRLPCDYGNNDDTIYHKHYY